MTEWKDIQKDLESGSFYIKDIVEKYKITRKKINFAVKRGDLEKEKWILKRTIPEIVRLKISNSRKKWLNDNINEHPWKNNDKFISKPCEILKQKLSNEGISFIEEYKPLCNRNYSIDIAIIDKLIAIEVNGNQHYNSDKTLKEYYRIRKENIEKVGWKIIDVYYSKVFDEQFLSELFNYLRDNTKHPIIDDFIIKTRKEKDEKKCESCGKIISNVSTLCSKCYGVKQRRTKRPDREILMMEIDSFGYSATGRKYGVSDNTIRKWLK